MNDRRRPLEQHGGPIHATAGTADLCGILLPDAARLQEEDAQFANQGGFSRHHPALPLYTEADARACLAQLRVVDFGRPFAPLPGLTATLQRAGHLLGAASVRLAHEGGAVLFSGDLGRRNDPIMPAPAPVDGADVIVVESTYGDRTHPTLSPEDELAPVLARVAARGGIAVVPTFAVGRAQALLHAIALLKARKQIPRSLPVFLDSPMAVHTTHLFEQHLGEHRLSEKESRALTRSSWANRYWARASPWRAA